MPLTGGPRPRLTAWILVFLVLLFCTICILSAPTTTEISLTEVGHGYHVGKSIKGRSDRSSPNESSNEDDGDEEMGDDDEDDDDDDDEEMEDDDEPAPGERSALDWEDYAKVHRPLSI